MDEQKLENIIAQGETSTVEFKSWVKAPSVKEIINFTVDELVRRINEII